MKKLLLLPAFIIGASAVNASGGKVKIMHHGNMIEVSVNALQAHLNHGDELAVFYKGRWMTVSERDALIQQENDNGDGNNEGGVIV